MAKRFPLFLDITSKKINVYGAGRIAARRIKALLPFGPCLTVCAPEVSLQIREAAEEGRLVLKQEVYQPGSIARDTWMVLAATDVPAVNEQIYRECQEKGILVNVCSNQTLCDFHFPGIVSKEDLIIGINAGGQDHSLAKRWTDRIRKEVEEDGDDISAEAASHFGES